MVKIVKESLNYLKCPNNTYFSLEFSLINIIFNSHSRTGEVKTSSVVFLYNLLIKDN